MYVLVYEKTIDISLSLFELRSIVPVDPANQAASQPASQLYGTSVAGKQKQKQHSQNEKRKKEEKNTMVDVPNGADGAA